MKLSTISNLPTISTGHTDDLKISTPSRRVWLSRLTREDGMPYDNQVTEEQYNNKTDVWETVKQYEAR